MKNEENDLIKLSTAVIHLRRASHLVDLFNEELSLCILQLADAICKDYEISHQQTDEIESIEKTLKESDELCSKT
ncbi:MAG: hypothetical protein J6W16_04640 [Methanobrevibacter sp.]|nr:hypothetical protein [Methanobrevibacter sp.]